ncbi:putative transcriptional regulator [Paraburkholderia youngii]
MITALSADPGRVTNDANSYAILSYFHKADADYGIRLANAAHADVTRVKHAAAHLSDNWS